MGLRDGRGRRGRALLERVDAVLPDGELALVYAASDNLVHNVRAAVPAATFSEPTVQTDAAAVTRTQSTAAAHAEVGVASPDAP